MFYKIYFRIVVFSTILLSNVIAQTTNNGVNPPLILPTVGATHGDSTGNSFKGYVAKSSGGNGRTYYVDCSLPVSPGGMGTITSPFSRTRSLSDIVFGPGDSVKLRRGVTCHGQLSLTGSGTLENPIVVEGYSANVSDSGRPKINGRNCRLDSLAETCTDLYGFDAQGASVVVRNGSYWTIKEIEVTNVSTKLVPKKTWIDGGSKVVALSTAAVADTPEHQVWRDGISVVEAKISVDKNLMSSYLDSLVQPKEVRNGILIMADANTVGKVFKLKGIQIENVYVHDIDGGAATTADNTVLPKEITTLSSENKQKQSNGVLILVRGTAEPSSISDVTVRDSSIENISRNGLVTWTDNKCRVEFGCTTTQNWVPFTNVWFYNNKLKRIQGDGIVLRATKGGMVERNAGSRIAQENFPGTSSAGFWVINSDYVTFKRNAVEFTGKRWGNLDGEAYDVDYGNRFITFEGNYSNRNEGGFMLLCGGCGDRAKSTWSVIRNNISVDDATHFEARALVQAFGTGTASGFPVAAISGNDNVFNHDGSYIYNNTFINRLQRKLYIVDSQHYNSIDFRNNLIYSPQAGLLYTHWGVDRQFDDYPNTYAKPALNKLQPDDCKLVDIDGWTRFRPSVLNSSDANFVKDWNLITSNWGNSRTGWSSAKLYFGSNMITDGAMGFCGFQQHNVLSGRKVTKTGSPVYDSNNRFQVVDLNYSNSANSASFFVDVKQVAPSVFDFQGSGPAVNLSTLSGYQLSPKSPAIAKGSWIAPNGQSQAVFDFFEKNVQPTVQMSGCSVDIGANQVSSIPVGSACN